MPIYTYRCDDGHTFEVQHKMDGSDAPGACPNSLGPGNDSVIDENLPDLDTCNAPITKLIAAPARTFPGADSWRK
jgi:putative FmdB family regulatory protein